MPQPPSLVTLSQSGGSWDQYLMRVHTLFCKDMYEHPLLIFKERRVSSPKNPLIKGLGAGFWHVISEGYPEDEREPDFRRCERICWIRYLVEKGETHPEIDLWFNVRDNKSNCLIWYREEYIVVLQDRKEYWLLKTAYPTTQRGRIRSLQKERNDWYKSQS